MWKGKVRCESHGELQYDVYSAYLALPPLRCGAIFWSWVTTRLASMKVDSPKKVCFP